MGMAGIRVSSGSYSAGRSRIAQACAAALLATLVTRAPAQPPQRDLLVEVRLVDGNEAALAQADTASARPSASWTSISSTPGPTDVPRTQSLRLLNGTRGSLQFMRSIPQLWTVAASGHAPSRSASAGAGGTTTAPTSASATSTDGRDGGGGSVVNALTWLQAGSVMSILPKWPGGRAPVTVHIELGMAHVGDKFAAEMPETSNQQVVTTVVSPLGRWTTFASSGSAPDAREGPSWSSAATRSSQTQSLQVRVLVP